MNILQMEDMVKGLPDQRLMQEAQSPSGQIPQYLSVSEIQRRADMRKRFATDQAEMPQGTVKDQILQQGIGALQGQPPQGPPNMPSPLPQGQGLIPSDQQFPPQSFGANPQAPILPPGNGMAAGGIVRYPHGGLTGFHVGPRAQAEAEAEKTNDGIIGLDPTVTPLSTLTDMFSDYSGKLSESMYPEGMYDPAFKFVQEGLNRPLDIPQNLGNIAEIARPVTEGAWEFGKGMASEFGIPTTPGPFVRGEAKLPEGWSPFTSDEEALTALDPTTSSATSIPVPPSTMASGEDVEAGIPALDPNKNVGEAPTTGGIEVKGGSPIQTQSTSVNIESEYDRMMQQQRDMANANALIQLGAGIGSGSYSKGLSAAGDALVQGNRGSQTIGLAQQHEQAVNKRATDMLAQRQREVEAGGIGGDTAAIRSNKWLLSLSEEERSRLEDHPTEESFLREWRKIMSKNLMEFGEAITPELIEEMNVAGKLIYHGGTGAIPPTTGAANRPPIGSFNSS